MIKPPLIIITGPTACGKTGLSIELAKRLDTEIISADSMQVYKFMDIGTAKVTKEEMDDVKHHLIDEIYPDEEYSVAIFQQLAKKYMSKIYSKGKVPIIAGGTGFYINALLYDNDFSETEMDYRYREELEQMSKEKGKEYLYEILKEIDPKSCEKIHMNNVKRVIRAIEFFKQTGNKISEHNEKESIKQSVYDEKFFILNMKRETLYERIDIRVDKMIECGLVEEVKILLEKGYSPKLVSMQGLGYKEIVQYLEGKISLEEAVFILKRDTRHFAKRQITWFKHQCNGKWINVDEFESKDEIIENMLKSM